jgi:hypothetical protein
MITSSILPAIISANAPVVPIRMWNMASATVTSSSRAGAASDHHVLREVRHPPHRPQGGFAVDRSPQDQAAVVNPAPQVAVLGAGIASVPTAAVTERDQELSARRMVDTAMLVIPLILAAAFFWMCTGKDDLSDPFLILYSWMWHALGVTAVSAAAYAVWQLVRRTSWTVRAVFVGIMLLNWALTTLFG